MQNLSFAAFAAAASRPVSVPQAVTAAVEAVAARPVAAFVVGRTYTTRSACDHDCIFAVTITRRSEKSVWFTSRGGEEKRAKIHVWSDAEAFYPFGQYSMAPIMKAND